MSRESPRKVLLTESAQQSPKINSSVSSRAEQLGSTPRALAQDQKPTVIQGPLQTSLSQSEVLYNNLYETDKEQLAGVDPLDHQPPRDQVHISHPRLKPHFPSGVFRGSDSMLPPDNRSDHYPQYRLQSPRHTQQQSQPQGLGYASSRGSLGVGNLYQESSWSQTTRTPTPVQNPDIPTFLQRMPPEMEFGRQINSVPSHMRTDSYDRFLQPSYSEPPEESESPPEQLETYRYNGAPGTMYAPPQVAHSVPAQPLPSVPNHLMQMNGQFIRGPNLVRQDQGLPDPLNNQAYRFYAPGPPPPPPPLPPAGGQKFGPVAPGPGAISGQIPPLQNQYQIATSLRSTGEMTPPLEQQGFDDPAKFPLDSNPGPLVSSGTLRPVDPRLPLHCRTPAVPAQAHPYDSRNDYDHLSGNTGLAHQSMAAHMELNSPLGYPQLAPPGQYSPYLDTYGFTGSQSVDRGDPMDIPGPYYEAKYKTQWLSEDVDELFKLLDSGEKYKWKYVSDHMELSGEKRVPPTACLRKFKNLFGEQEAESDLKSSLYYVAFRSGWEALKDQRPRQEYGSTPCRS